MWVSLPPYVHYRQGQFGMMMVVVLFDGRRRKRYNVMTVMPCYGGGGFIYSSTYTTNSGFGSLHSVTTALTTVEATASLGSSSPYTSSLQLLFDCRQQLSFTTAALFHGNSFPSCTAATFNVSPPVVKSAEPGEANSSLCLC